MTVSNDAQADAMRRTRHAKTPLSRVAGPYGHPVHPVLVTIPIGAWVSALVFDIATKVNDHGSRSLADASYWLIGIGIVGAVLAAAFGLMDLLRIPRGTRAFRFGLTHMVVNLAVVVLFIVNFLWRHATHAQQSTVSGGQLALTVIGLVLLGVSGGIGGMLAYSFGVRVAAEEDQRQAFGTTSRR